MLYIVPSSILGYQPCIAANEWYVSLATIRCSSSFAATGYAPDQKDCSKYYICDSYVGPDGMSSGKNLFQRQFQSNQYYEFFLNYIKVY